MCAPTEERARDNAKDCTQEPSHQNQNNMLSTRIEAHPTPIASSGGKAYYILFGPACPNWDFFYAARVLLGYQYNIHTEELFWQINSPKQLQL